MRLHGHIASFGFFNLFLVANQFDTEIIFSLFRNEAIDLHRVISGLKES